MASTPVIDIEKLLEPISQDTPCGEDLRLDYSPSSPYQTIKTARTLARAAERNSVFDNDTSEADTNWRVILDNAPDIIKNQSKDLELACWLTEALVRRHGFAGLKDGFELLKGLVSQFWDGLYPMPDEDGIETRVSPLAGLNGEGAEGVLIAPIRNVNITEGDFPAPFNLWQYKQVLDIARLPNEETKAEKASKLGFSQEDIERAVDESSEAFYVGLKDDISACIEHFRALSQQLSELCGVHDAPPTSTIIGVLQECLGAINHLGKDKLPTAEEDTDVDTESDTPSDSVNGSENNASAPKRSEGIANRDAAFKQLKEIAQFFRKTEPHSPVSYVLEKAVKWGNMPLDKLITELIPDDSSRDHYGILTGVKISDENE